MLQPAIQDLNTLRVVLASSSPRRKELLNKIKLNVELCAPKFEENLRPEDFPNFSEFVEETAHQKVLEVENRFRQMGESTAGLRIPDIIIGADTMVTFDGRMYGKPKSKQDAINTLKLLSGNTNVVYTGVAVKYRDRIVKFTEKTEVRFAKLTDENIRDYVETGEPLDKAGSYGIQDIGSTLVEGINGDFYTVMGLPLHRLAVTLAKVHDDIFSS